MRARIACVVDEPRFERRFRRQLVAEGHDVACVGSAEALQELVARTPFDLVVLGLPLADSDDGLSLTRYLRERTSAGIILMSGKTTPIDRALGLEVGADDYLTLPLNWHEARARLRSVLRRLRGPPRTTPPQAVARFAGWRLDPVKRDLISAEGAIVMLTGAELDLLMALISQPGRVIARERLLALIAGRDWTPDDRAVDQRISRLRHKLEEPPRNPRLIRTIRNQGYLLAAPVAWD